MILKVVSHFVLAMAVIFIAFTLSLYVYVDGLKTGCVAGVTHEYKYHLDSAKLSEDIEFCHIFPLKILK
jgi:hypothetical protein